MNPKRRKPFHKRPAWSILLFDLTFLPWLKTVSTPFIERKPWAAFLATFATHPIAGMFYLGRWKRAIVYSILSPLSITLEVYMLLHINDVPNPPFFFMEAIVLRLVGAIDAYYIATSWQSPTKKRFYTRWYSAVGLWIMLMASMLVGYTIFRFTVAEVFSATVDIDKPNIMKDDFFLLWKKTQTYQPGDIASFRQEMYGQPRSFFWRVIAIPGDTVEIKNSQLIINNKKVETKALGEGLYEETLPNGQSYNIYRTTPSVTMPASIVPQGQYFLLSDNRNIYQKTDFFKNPQFIYADNLVGKVVYICKAPCPLKGKI